jgi:NRPS condensation-like uncharacterized protein
VALERELSPPVPTRRSRRLPATGVDLAYYDWRGRGEPVIGLECAFRGRLDERVLTRAVELLVEAEPMLGFRLVPDAPVPEWTELPREQHDLLTVVRAPEDYEAVRRTGVDAARGAQLDVRLLNADEGARLLVRITHALADGFSLQSLAARLASLYSAVQADPEHRPPTGALPERDHGRLLASIPRRERVLAVAEFLRFLAPRVLPRRTHHPPLPSESHGPWVPVMRRVPSLAVLAYYGKRRGATVNDLVLAAAYRALAASGWDRTSALHITITVDLRRWCLPPEVAGLIANLSAWEVPFLDRDLGRSFDDTLHRVSAVMGRRKRSRPGLASALLAYRAVKDLPAERGRLDREPQRETRNLLTLSNEGLLDRERLTFGGEAPVSAHVLPPFVALPRLHLCVSGYGDTLTLASVTPENGAAAVGEFMDAIVDELPHRADRRAAVAGVEPEDGGGLPRLH